MKNNLNNLRIFLIIIFTINTVKSIKIKTPQILDKGEFPIPFMVYDVKYKQANQPPIIAVAEDVPAYTEE